MRKITIVIVCILMITTFSWIFPIKISIAEPPNAPKDPNPPDNSTDVPIEAELSWTCIDPDPGDEPTFDVYLGKNSTPLIVEHNITESRFTPPELLSYDTEYYWRIVAWDGSNASNGPLWNFTTVELLNQPPEIPNDPDPSDDALVISIDANLSWSCSDPDGDTLTYDVYFGTTSPPGKVSGNQSNNSYDPGIMSYGTTYYWKIVAWDIYDATRAGPVWQFQTNQLPNQPSNPSPGNQSTNMSINTDLTWSGGDPDDDSVTYDVYFGTTSSPSRVGFNQSGLNYNLVMLAYNTSYYWRIVAWDNHSASKVGPLWWFKTRNDTNQPPYVPNTPSPSDGFQGASVDMNLSWVGGDPDGNSVLYDIYFGTSSSPPKIENNHSGTEYDLGTLGYVTVYYWKIIAWDNSSATSSGPIWNFTTKSEFNHSPKIPGSPSPKNDSTRISINADLSWTGGDPDPGDTVMYDVYFGPSSSPSKKVTNQTATSYDPGTMSYSTTYYWKIIAWDSSHNSSTSALFHFTTASQSGGGGGEPPQQPQNIKPVADASAGEPYQGYLNATILFDGSKSHDPDGNITSWSWNFGDGTTAHEMTVFHTFVKAGIYTVTLTVTDDKEASDTDTATCVIRPHNQPPTVPSIQGPTSGTKNNLYTYTVTSTDVDNDPVQYTFEWGESVFQSSGFVPSGTNYSVNHSWASPGRYNLTVIVSDNHTNSSSKITIYIDAIQTRGAGYLLDNDGDGSYDAFYSDETHQTVSVQKNGDSYLIDKDGDGTWEYVYNATYGLTSYVEPRKTPGFEFVFVLCAAMVALFLWKKRYRPIDRYTLKTSKKTSIFYCISEKEKRYK